ncbi:MAG: hydrogenase maturation nickel metallochaperone HypA [Candidatus Marinimicrobia bacterium]|jgi:hydrogenase nickel incorporation protein HypA/HybF|nr:hydrogenase maturation nickel metallochaperone HypA [Candidatus Neomarinimicrobiota bacterium]|tara:strand:- start:13246 stop:13587 length:342 start_codon:yes stop_codon:yes gene_type:complete
MHEMSLAINIVEIACQTAKQNGAEEITSIEIEVGQLAGVLEDSLSFCFQAARNNTPAENAKLDIISIPGKGYCRTCDHTFETDSFFTLCLNCQGLAVEIIQGKDLKVKSINVD